MGKHKEDYSVIMYGENMVYIENIHIIWSETAMIHQIQIV